MTSGAHLSKELFDLVKSIGEARSKQEEDKIIQKEVEVLKEKIKQRNVSEKKMKEYMIRAIYVEMLGHNAQFSNVPAINLATSKNMLVKRVAYLACTLFLDYNSDLVLLLVSTIQRDLQSNNNLEVFCALNAICKLANGTLAHAIADPVSRLLNHESELVRKKAVMVLHRLYLINPTSVDGIDIKMKKALCDKDPSVMTASLNYFYDVTRKDPIKYKELIPSFVVILKQVIDHRLPREYDYHRMPAPWVQMKILEILAVLGSDNKEASENIYDILKQVLNRADDTGINIGCAIVYQCLKTVTSIYPNQTLLETAANTISRFVGSEIHNLRYIGIVGLASIVKIDSKYALQHQNVVVDCLEDTDDTLKTKTLELLYRMTNRQNVSFIVDKLLAYLKIAPHESSVRRDLVYKINELATQYHPGNAWFVKTMNSLFEGGGDVVTREVANNFLMSITDLEKEGNRQEFKDTTINVYNDILRNKASIPDIMVQVISWVLGEYGATSANANIEEIQDLITLLCEVMGRSYENEYTRCWIVSALTKLHSSIGFRVNKSLDMVLANYSRSKSIILQQRCYEHLELIKMKNSIVPLTGLAFNPDNDIENDPSMSFLNSYVSHALSSGARPYDEEKRKGTSFISMTTSDKSLNFAPYVPSVRGVVQKPSNISGREIASNPMINDTLSTTLNINKPTKWSHEGYVDAKAQPKPAPVLQNEIFLRGDSFTSTNKQTTVRNEPRNTESAQHYASEDYNLKGREAARPIYEDPKKKSIAASIFSGIGETTAPQVTETKPKEKPPTFVPPAKVQQPMDLLEMGFDEVKPQSLSPTVEIRQAPQEKKPNNLNLLEDIFSADSMQSISPIQQQKPVQPPPTNPNYNPDKYKDLDSLFDVGDMGGIKPPAPVGIQFYGGQQQKYPPQMPGLGPRPMGIPGQIGTPQQPFFMPTGVPGGMPGALPGAMGQFYHKPPHFEPLRITTEIFGNEWLSVIPQKQISLFSAKIVHPNIFSEVMQKKLQIQVVQIINNEIICAAIFNNQSAMQKAKCLFHSMVLGNGQINITIKADNPAVLGTVQGMIEMAINSL